MKLLKIGSAPSCSIVFNSEYVSGLHAELQLTDDGKIFLEDKNSLNGTYVGNKKLTPNEEVRVQRGDLVRFGDCELNWNKVPMNYGPKNGEIWYNIGSSQKVEIPVSSPFVGRFHAILMQKDKKFFIMDNDSKNGTLVDGKKIPVNKFIPLKRGQNVICGDSDVTEQIQAYMPQPLPWLKPILIALASVVAIVGIFFIVQGMISRPKNYASATVYVQASYHYIAVLEDIPVSPTVWSNHFSGSYGTLEFQKSLTYSGTAFFIDKNGVMATNRHIAVPWEYEDEDVRTSLINEVNNYRKTLLPVTECKTYDDIYKLQNSEWGKMILDQWINSRDKSKTNLNAMIAQMLQAKVVLKGVMDYISVGYPERNYTEISELDKCFVLGDSKTKEKDVALIQLNVKKTPASIVDNIIDINTKIYNGVMEPLADKLVMIGYPQGTAHSLIESTHSLQPVVREVMVGMKPDRYTFEFQGESIGGSSGAPIYNRKNGMLYGINYGHLLMGATFGKACKAQCLKELYDEYKDIL